MELRDILNDTDGFGFPITVTNPSGTVAALVGFSNDIAQVIDPETGQAVSGRLASVALSMEDMDAIVGFGQPKAIADPDSRPWVITFDDILGISHTFKVNESNPDRGLGLITCTLEAYDIEIDPVGQLDFSIASNSGHIITAGV